MSPGAREQTQLSISLITKLVFKDIKMQFLKVIFCPQYRKINMPGSKKIWQKNQDAHM